MLVQFRYGNGIIEEKHVDFIPQKNELIAFFSYNAKELKKMNVQQFVVDQVIHFYRDPIPPEGFTSSDLGTEYCIIQLITINEYNERNKSEEK